MARRRPQGKTRRRAGGPARLYTLSEVARGVGISMPTAQKYKKRFQARIPSRGSGRRQRYPAEALAVFRTLRAEGAARSGRPRRTAASSRPKAGGTAALSLAEVARRTHISYPTLLRYLRLHGREIPQVGRGRGRRFPEGALPVFTRLRAESKRGPKARALAAGRGAAPPDGALAERLRRLEARQARLERRLAEVVRLLRRPLRVTLQRKP